MEQLIKAWRDQQTALLAGAAGVLMALSGGMLLVMAPAQSAQNGGGGAPSIRMELRAVETEIAEAIAQRQQLEAAARAGWSQEQQRVRAALPASETGGAGGIGDFFALVQEYLQTESGAADGGFLLEELRLAAPKTAADGTAEIAVDMLALASPNAALRFLDLLASPGEHFGAELGEAHIVRAFRIQSCEMSAASQDQARVRLACQLVAVGM